MKKYKIKFFEGMEIFTLIWFGELVSIIGTAMTRFALLIWAYEQIGKASTTALLGFFSILPYVFFSPAAGAIVDRFDRKKIMIFSDLAAGATTIAVFILFTTGNLKVWHLFLTEAFAGAFEAFQLPAFSAAITMLVTKDKYARASGMRSFASWSSQVFAPILGGALMIKIGLNGVMIIDIITFVFAVSCLIMISIPHPKGKEVKGDKNNLIEDIKFGIHYLKQRRGLLSLIIIFFVINLLAATTYFGILPAMILARSGGDKIVLGKVQSLLGLGGVVGSIIVSLKGCPKKKIFTILTATGVSFIVGDLLFAVGTSFYAWCIAAFLSSLFIPFIMGAESALWQSKVEPNLQGRIFSIRGMLQIGSMPMGYLLGGILADYIFEPAMSNGGALRNTLGWLVGTGKGSGMAAMFLATGILGIIISISGFFMKDLRDLEKDLPDII